MMGRESLFQFLSDADDKINECSQTDEDAHGGVHTVEDGGGSGSGGADDSGFEVFGDGGLGNTDDTLVDTVCGCDFSTVDAL